VNRFIRNLLAVLLVAGCIYSQQIEFVTDTVTVALGYNRINIKPFIIDSTLNLFHNGKWINEYDLDPISGIIILPDSIHSGEIFIISYKHLVQTVPVQVGPGVLDLPILDSLLTNFTPDSTTLSVTTDINTNQISDVISTGTVYRNMEISPIGGTNFTGGLQLQIQGSLSDDIHISGVLSDQSIPIQPEGNTQTLDEIDKVYLEVTHPYFKINAGDIEVNMNSGKYLNIKRKLTGIKNTFNYNNWSGGLIYGSSNGNYHKLSFKGNDGSQGPYFLTSKIGNRDIVVLAGTERVWLNGELLLRGENHDYWIDYNAGEITFTPQRLIHFDSDIFIEYQYSDFQYNKYFISSTLQRSFSNNSQISVVWIRESDLFNPRESGLSAAVLDSMRLVGDSKVEILDIIEDQNGDYILVNDIFIYQPSATGQHYQVNFQNNQNGEYIRKISAAGKIFFEFLDMNLRSSSDDLYSPRITYINPVKAEIGQIAGRTKIGKFTRADYDLSVSIADQNIYSSIDDENNIGFGYQFRIIGEKLPISKSTSVNYALRNWRRSERFNDLQNDRDPLFNREWNLKDSGLGKETLISGDLALIRTGLGKSSLNWAQYNGQGTKHRKLGAGLNYQTVLIPEIFLKYNQVNSNQSEFKNTRTRLKFLKGNWHPVILYNQEITSESYQFDDLALGIEYSQGNQSGRISISKRVDKAVQDSSSSNLSKVNESYYGKLDYSARSKRGWISDIIYRRRINNDLENSLKTDHDLASIKLLFRRSDHPVQYDLQSKLEETLTETRAVVYDSVGSGLGQYRYDPEFDEYVPDPNGDFISFNVLTGDRKLLTHFENHQALRIDFGKSRVKWLKAVKFKSDLQIEFRGKTLALNKLLSPGLNDSQITKSRQKIRNDLEYQRKSKKERIHFWLEMDRDINGLDPRGNNLADRNEKGLDINIPINSLTLGFVEGSQHNITIKSGFSDTRNRDVDGWWIKGGIKLRIERVWNIDLTVQGGNDWGSHLGTAFSAKATGLKLKAIYFSGMSGRIQAQFEWFYAELVRGSSLPPEALNGLPNGQSIKFNMQGQILLGDNLSLNIGMNYLDNTRYNNFISMTGEIRAYF